MNSDIYKLTEAIQETLGIPNKDTVSYLIRNISYRDKKYAVTFYKVSKNNGESFFWICNPFNIIPYASTENQELYDGNSN